MKLTSLLIMQGPKVNKSSKIIRGLANAESKVVSQGDQLNMFSYQVWCGIKGLSCGYIYDLSGDVLWLVGVTSGNGMYEF